MSTLDNAKMASLKDKLAALEEIKEAVAEAEAEVKKDKKPKVGKK